VTQPASAILARIAAAARPARPWLHISASPRIAQFLVTAGARPGAPRTPGPINAPPPHASERSADPSRANLAGPVLLQADPARVNLTDPDILALCDEFFDAFARGRPDAEFLGYLWRSIDNEGRLRPLDERMRNVIQWNDDHRSGEAEGAREAG
jgi:hypothetical protein